MRRPTCACCRRKVRLNRHGLCPDCAVCLHCERRPSVDPLGLCERCAATPGVRATYTRRRGWTPAWEMHLRRKTEEVQRALRARARRFRPPRDPPASA
jgi:hypothetical protein